MRKDANRLARIANMVVFDDKLNEISVHQLTPVGKQAKNQSNTTVN
jgi:hypothetical protein